jgi:hypothetical protein
MAFDPLYTFAASLALFIASIVFIVRLSQGRLKDIRGPKSQSLWLGECVCCWLSTSVH